MVPHAGQVGRGTGEAARENIGQNRKYVILIIFHDYGGGAPSRVPLHCRLPSPAGWTPDRCVMPQQDGIPTMGCRCTGSE